MFPSDTRAHQSRRLVCTRLIESSCSAPAREDVSARDSQQALCTLHTYPQPPRGKTSVGLQPVCFGWLDRLAASVREGIEQKRTGGVCESVHQRTRVRERWDTGHGRSGIRTRRDGYG